MNSNKNTQFLSGGFVQRKNNPKNLKLKETFKGK